jgi:hypothetical protein
VNDKTILNDDLEMMWKETLMTCLKLGCMIFEVLAVVKTYRIDKSERTVP